MKCKFNHDGDCCNCGAAQYMAKCEQACMELVPMTNADRIRAMDDDELAEWFKTGIIDCCPCCIYFRPCRLEYDTDTVYYSKKYDCKKGIIDWLQSQAE